MFNKILIILLLHLALTTPSAFGKELYSAYDDGESLYKACQDAILFSNNEKKMKANQDVLNFYTCDAYLVGMWKAIDVQIQLLEGNGKTSFLRKFGLYCIPEDTTRNELRKVTVNYLKAHPELIKETSSWVLIASAWNEKYHCENLEKKKNKK